MKLSKSANLVGVFVFAAALVLYLKTMAPGLTFWDCGEFIASSYVLGVPHPPGSPLYVLLGRVFTLLPIADPAWRVVLMSVISSSIGVWCAYQTTVALIRRALGGHSLQAFADAREISSIVGAAVAALTLAVSYTYWFNATEAEVYGYSLLFVSLGLWLIVYWEGTQHGSSNDRWLFLIAYVFGIGGGIHLLCLLTIPSILILAWFADDKLRRLTLLLIGLGVWSILLLAVAGPGQASNILTLIALAGLLYHLYNNEQRSFWLLIGIVVVFAIGYSTYASLYIRSGLNPVIDENDPETWDAFLKFLNREQYGTDSQLLGMLSGRASRVYQFWHLQMKYFFQQFPFPLIERVIEFRRATDESKDVVSVSLVPYLLGLGGLFWHLRQDWRRFVAILALFVIMGFGLSLYLNMPDPQPRERHYVFGGMFYAFAIWMGMGWAGILDSLRRRIAMQAYLLAGIGVFGLLIPVGIGARLYHIEDRTGDYVAYDYGYNILQSCDENSLLFTNGDNDTFPLWYLQEVEGIRKDVRVINLSLLNTNWYIKQLRDRDPKVAIGLPDSYIDSVLTDTQMVDLYKRAWQEPIISQVRKTLKDAGFDVDYKPQPGHDLIRIQDVMIIGLLKWNEWKRPIHFAITVAGSNRLGLDPYLRMTGMTMRLVKERDLGPDRERLERNLFEVYKFRNLTNTDVFQDINTARLLGNYRACVLQLAEVYQEEGNGEEMVQLMNWAQERLPFGWETYYQAGDYLANVGQLDMAAEFIEQAGHKLLNVYGEQDVASYDNITTIASILLNAPYSAIDRAEGLYRAAIAKEPHRWDAYFELAATLQAKGNPAAGLKILTDYRSRYGEVDKLIEAEQVLQNALRNGTAAAESSAAAQQ